jgi:glycerol kinase
MLEKTVKYESTDYVTADKTAWILDDMLTRRLKVIDVDVYVTTIDSWMDTVVGNNLLPTT